MAKRTEIEVRKAVEARVGAVTDAAWEFFEESEFVESAQSGMPGALEKLVQLVRKSRTSFGGEHGCSPKPVRTATPDPVRLLTAEENERSRVMHEFEKRQLADDEDIRHFRQRVNRGRALSQKNAWLLLDSHAAQFLSVEEFAEHEIPIVGHWAKKKGPPQDEIGERVRHRRLRFLIGFGVVERVIEFRATILQIRLDARIQARIQAELRALGVEKDEPSWCDAPLGRMTYLLPDSTPEEIGVYPGSVLDELRAAAEAVAWRFEMTPPEAIWCVLTSIAPKHASVRLEISTRRTQLGEKRLINLSIRPWVSLQSVAAIYAAALKHCHGPSTRRRHISIVTLQKFAFVESQRRRDGSLPPWRTVFEAWKGQKRVPLGYTWRNFRQENERARIALLEPTYVDGKDRVLAMNQARLLRMLRNPRIKNAARTAALEELRKFRWK